MGVTAIDIDYYEEIKTKADKLDEIKLKLIEEHDKIAQESFKQGWGRYGILTSYKDGLRFALDLIDAKN